MQESFQSICLLCQQNSLILAGELPELPGVTSDAKPWPQCGAIFICNNCGHIQKRVDGSWRQNMDTIYEHYEMYPLSDGEEQVVFDGPIRTVRSERILDHFLRWRTRRGRPLPNQGRLLDIGCGNGALLKSFQKIFPTWRLAGLDHNARFRNEIDKIPGVENFYSDTSQVLGRRFDLVTLLHLLEHLPEPIEFLGGIRQKLTENGILLIQIPNCRENPFDLLVYDHCSHFLPATIERLASALDLEVLGIFQDWIPREISVIMSSRKDWRVSKTGSADEGDPSLLVRNDVQWLKRLTVHAAQVSSSGPSGIFGTSLAGTWLCSVLGLKARFFVDEDPSKVHKKYLDRPVFLPEEIPPGSSVYLALAHPLAGKVYGRLQRRYPRVNFVVPPEVSA